jgi:hypothetical protein
MCSHPQLQGKKGFVCGGMTPFNGGSFMSPVMQSMQQDPKQRKLPAMSQDWLGPVLQPQPARSSFAAV